MKKIAIAAAALILSTFTLATSASAWIVCNRDGECWHVRHRAAYRAEWGLVIHPDGWRWRAHERYRWREHEGRGYWRHGVWIEF